MNSIYSRQSTIRFRRFTRKAYAVFASLKRVVTIGHLAIDIANCQEKKESHSLTLLSFSIKGNDEHVDERDRALTELQEEQLMSILPLTTAVNAVAVPANDRFNNFHIGCFSKLFEKQLFLWLIVKKLIAYSCFTSVLPPSYSCYCSHKEMGTNSFYYYLTHYIF